MFLLIALLAAVAIASLCIGRYPIPLRTICGIVLAHVFPLDVHWSQTEQTVVELVRAPRVLLAMSAGVALAISGAALQGVFRNPLVGPEILGISSGASFGGALAILLGASIAGVIGGALAFGIAALVIVFLLSRLAGKSAVLSLVLAGVITGAFFGALVGIAQYAADPQQKLPGIVFWLLGSFSGADYQRVLVLAIPTLFAGGLLLLLRWRINLLSLGDEDAAALGVNVSAIRWLVLVSVALIVAAQVSVSGGIGWVGLIVPHFARMLVGPDHRVLLPTSAMLGGIYLLVIDDCARSLTQNEIPLGILTALIGTPIFGYLLWKTQARGWTHE